MEGGTHTGLSMPKTLRARIQRLAEELAAENPDLMIGRSHLPTPALRGSEVVEIAIKEFEAKRKAARKAKKTKP